ncbi:MAG: wax ester/triacylglycerol synthase family O-acyltransferase [Halioglobus sp.]|nr:wax ester/triacylglycerol synthase family O-acyltransferase [Halioglobus sp.]
MKRLGIADRAFLLAETREAPMHVGGIHLFTLPQGVQEQRFLHQMADNLRATEQFQSPFGERLKMGPLGALGPVFWEPDDALDPDYHIRHSALPRPGRYRELFALVSRLHGAMMDRHRPLWEMHLIEGLQKRQFAVYSKYHHAAIDGIRSMHLTQSMFSTDARARIDDSPLSVQAWERYRARLQQAEPLGDAQVRNVAEALKAQLDSAANLYGGLKQCAAAWTGRGAGLNLPWLNVPRSSINTPVDGARRFVAQSWPFERVRAVGKALDGTFNDAVLAMCAGALRRFLQNLGELPEQSLKAMVPLSLRRAGDIDSSNAVATVSADLATHLADPVERFETIRSSMRAGKALLQDMTPREAELFVLLTQMPGLLLMPLGLTSRFPPYSTVISNVPGPRRAMYWNGARLDGIYPASIVTEGVALNITLVTYDQNVDFGITACRRSLPQVQRLIDDMEDALSELEEAAGLRAGKAGASTGTGTKAKTKTKTRTKVKAKAKAKTKANTKTKAKSGAAAKVRPKTGARDTAQTASRRDIAPDRQA